MTKKINKKVGLQQFFEADSTLQDELVVEQALYVKQPVWIQRFLDAESQKMIDAIRKNQKQVVFCLPGQVVTDDSQGKLISLPEGQREQEIGSMMNRLIRTDLRFILRQRLLELIESPQLSVSVAARLFRYSLTMTIVHVALPSGKNVKYHVPAGEEIPSDPIIEKGEKQSAITQESDAIVENGSMEENRGEFQRPFVPAALRFYLPQWVILDENGKLLVQSVSSAEDHISYMQSFLAMLHTAVSLAPYIISDPEYQRKRYGMLGQLINQGRALAIHETLEIVKIIKARAAASDLNRGLHLSLPYFDDQVLEMHTYDFEIIPAGRILFVPAFVVRATREESAKIAQDTRLSPSTRKYLLVEFSILEKEFDTARMNAETPNSYGQR